MPAPAAVGRLTSVSRDEASGSDDAAERAAMDDRARNCQSIIPTPWRFVGETVSSRRPTRVVTPCVVQSAFVTRDVIVSIQFLICLVCL